jgi:RNA polymerase sigma-70 factor, ECF subfamily
MTEAMKKLISARISHHRSGHVNQTPSLRNREVMDDDELIGRIASGDDGALKELFVRNSPWLAARLRSALPARDVEDVLQETFLAVWRGARVYHPQGTPGAWLWGIARRQAAGLMRRRGLEAPAALSPAAADPLSADDPASAALSRAQLEEALAVLGPDGSPEREVWRLLYEEDRPVAEVARLMGVPEGTVKSRAYRARQLLRAALERTATEEGAP